MTSFYYEEILYGEDVDAILKSVSLDMKYKYKCIFEDSEINVLVYTLETLIAEKFETIMIRNVTTTRAKDFYDLYVLIDKYFNYINKTNLVKAMENTFKKRRSNFDINEFKEIAMSLRKSKKLKVFL